MSSESKNRIISASQIGDFTTCPRKWWFKRLPKLPEPPKSYFTFGTVLHECVERFLCSTENGRVPFPKDLELIHGDRLPWVYNAVDSKWESGPFKGQLSGDSTDLYPEGWETVEERDGGTATLTPNEAKQVRKVVNEAIENGTIAWEPLLEVEREININVIPGVDLTGFIDIYKPPEHDDDCALGLGGEWCDCNNNGTMLEVHDHKSYSKGSIRYLKQAKPSSPNYVGEDQQLLTYATAASMLDGYSGDVIVRHNQYPKFPGRKVRFMASEPIPQDRLHKHWEWVQEEAAQMLKVAKIERWEDAPGPRVDDACQKYGGCPFSGICTRQESIDAYRSRVEREKQAADGQPRINLRLEAPRKRRTSTGGNAMPQDIFAGARAKRGAKAEAQAKAAKPASNPVSKAAPKAAPKAAAPAGHGAPWASATCKACKGSGFNAAGNPCPICAATAKNRGVPVPTDYVIESEGDGFAAVAKESAIEKLQGLGAPLQWSSADGASDVSVPEPQVRDAEEEAAEEEAAEEEAAEEEAAEEEAAEEEAAEEEAAEEEAAEEEAAEEPKAKASAKAPPKASVKAQTAKRGRPPVGLTVLVGCSQLVGPRRDTILSSQVLARFGAELAEAMGAESYWELDTWKRRERLAQRADHIVSELAKMVVIHPGELGNDDVGALVRAMMSVQEGLEQVVIAG